MQDPTAGNVRPPRNDHIPGFSPAPVAKVPHPDVVYTSFLINVNPKSSNLCSIEMHPAICPLRGSIQNAKGVT